MNLHTNKELFQNAVVAAAQRFNIPEIYIEKDYWVTVALYNIFHSPVAEEAVFKGGTALAKCYKLVNRFSEDVDIVVLKKGDEPGNQLRNKIKAVTNAVSAIMPEVEVEGITNKVGQIRKTAHQFNKGNFKGSYGQVREQIIVEATWLGSSDPYITAEVSCYITEMMKATDQNAMIKEYNLIPFTVKVLSKERTFCEKIMSLVRFSQTEDPYFDLSNKIRHIYDIHMMLKNDEIITFFNSPAFEELINTVGKDDVISFKNNNKWLANHPADAIVFSNPEKTWEKIKTAYSTVFKELVFGEFPDESELVKTLKRVADRLKKVNWQL